MKFATELLSGYYSTIKHVGAVERFIYWILDSLYNEGTWSYLFYLKLNDVKNLEQHAGPDKYVHHN